MLYQPIYDALIASARANPPQGYTERHHIVPRCMGGSDDPENLITLSARQHFVAHLLLAKIHGGKLIHAAFRMSQRWKYTSRTYRWLREAHAQEVSKKRSGVPLSASHRLSIGYGLLGQKRKPYKSNANKGKKRDPEVLKKSWETRRQNGTAKPSIEHRKKLSYALRNRPKSPQHKAVLAENLKKARAAQKLRREPSKP